MVSEFAKLVLVYGLDDAGIWKWDLWYKPMVAKLDLLAGECHSTVATLVQFR